MAAAVEDERLEVAVGLHALEERVGQAHVECLLDPKGELEEVEPVDGEVTGERVAGGEPCCRYADGVGDEPPKAGPEVIIDKDAPGSALRRVRGIWSAGS